MESNNKRCKFPVFASVIHQILAFSVVTPSSLVEVVTHVSAQHAATIFQVEVSMTKITLGQTASLRSKGDELEKQKRF
jgi:hypothetical protein